MIKPEVSYEDFKQLDLRLAKVLTAEAVEKTDRLVKMTLEIGEPEPATVVAGIREFYDPEALVGKQLAYLANLAPRKIRGIESKGMVLAAAVFEENDSALSVLGVDTFLPDGAEIG